MLNEKVVAVVIPAYNEENQIASVIETLPDFVDRIVVINDGSKDKTADVVKGLIDTTGKAEVIKRVEAESPIVYQRIEDAKKRREEQEDKFFAPHDIVNKEPETDRLIHINLKENSGVGAAVAVGYKWCRDNEIDCIAKLDGDGQMDPAELLSVCEPVVKDGIDYVKGNRLMHRDAWDLIPKIRFLGNSVLSALTKIASGYWHISDTQTAYSAISLKALKSIQIHKLYKRYGYPNDILVKLNMAYCTIKEVEIKPIYDVGENSKMKIMKVIPRISWILVKSFFKRLWVKYLFKDFHPLFLLYNLGFFLGLIMIPYGVKIVKAFITNTQLSYEPILAFLFLFISGFQSLFFAMWMDIQDNERFYK